MDIARVIVRTAAGDRAAFAEVVVTFQRPLFGFLGRMGLTEAVAAETAQETFIRAARGSLSDADALGIWVEFARFGYLTQTTFRVGHEWERS